MKNIYNKKIVQRTIWILLFIIIWQLLYSFKIYPVQLFPSVIQILEALINDVSKGELLVQAGFSLIIVFEGLIIGFFASIILSYLSMISSVLNSLIETLIAILHPLPGIALLPLIILWAGLGQKAVLIVIIHSVLWPMIINIKAGFNSIDNVYIEVAKNNGINKIQLFLKVLIPLSLTNIIAGLNIGWSRAWRALISSEIIFGAIGSIGGIGWYIFEKRSFMDTAGMYGGLIVIILIGVFVEDFVFTRINNNLNSRK